MSDKGPAERVAEQVARGIRERLDDRLRLRRARDRKILDAAALGRAKGAALVERVVNAARRGLL